MQLPGERTAAAEAGRLSVEAERTIEGREHLVDSRHVLRLAESGDQSAYDCEFVALAEALGRLWRREGRPGVIRAHRADE